MPAVCSQNYIVYRGAGWGGLGAEGFLTFLPLLEYQPLRSLQRRLRSLELLYHASELHQFLRLRHPRVRQLVAEKVSHKHAAKKKCEKCEKKKKKKYQLLVHCLR